MARRSGREVRCGLNGYASGKFVARVPKSIHAQLAARAKMEGVSLNAMVLTLIAKGLGQGARTE